MPTRLTISGKSLNRRRFVHSWVLPRMLVMLVMVMMMMTMAALAILDCSWNAPLPRAYCYWGMTRGDYTIMRPNYKIQHFTLTRQTPARASPETWGPAAVKTDVA